MRQIDLTFRIIKMGRHTVSIAVCALTGMIMMGAGGAMADVIVNVGNDPVNESVAAGGAVNANASGNPAVEFRGVNVTLTATVATGVNLQGTGPVAPVAVADITTTNLGVSTTNLVMSGNNQVNGSVTADYITAAGTNLSGV